MLFGHCSYTFVEQESQSMNLSELESPEKRFSGIELKDK